MQHSMVPSPPSVEETLVDSLSSPSPPSPTKPYSGPRSSQNQYMGSVNSQIYSPSTSSSSTASTASPEASRSLSHRRNINNLVIETGDVSTAVNPRQRRIFSYIEGEAEVLGTANTASDDRQHPFQDYYEFANTLRQQEGRSDTQPLAGTNGIDLPDRNSTSELLTTAEDFMNKPSSTRPAEEDSTTSFMGTSSKSSNLTGLTPSNSTGSVIWVGKRNSRAAAAAVTSSSAAEVDQPSYYETSVGVGVGGGNYELGEITSTTAVEVPSTKYYHYSPTMTTATATSPRLAPELGPGSGAGPTIPPRTTSHQQQQHKVGSVSPIKDRFEQLFEQQKQQKQSQPQNETSPARVAAAQKGDKDTTKSPMNKNHVSATVAMFNEGT